MRITTVNARNYRTLEDFEIRFQPHYCAISGKNNAGKSAVVSIIQLFLNEPGDFRFDPFNASASYPKDSTQWVQSSEMIVSLGITVGRNEDSEIFFVVERFSPAELSGESASVTLTYTYDKSGSSRLSCEVNDDALDAQNASEVLKKLRSSSNLVTHNSTQPDRRLYFVTDSYIEVLETSFLPEDRKKISEAQTRLQNSVKKAAKQHKDELDKLLGRLNEKFQVELSSIAGGHSAKFPLEVKLSDKRVHVSLKDWGVGTQNRTRILISVLEAIRTRDSATEENRTTPVFIVEEPESFLHPSAQAEFGQVLNSLAEDLNVQIIATTHSPYLLNQSNPEANYLIERKISRNIPKESVLRNTAGPDWMLPFAENLGIVPEEFSDWKHLFGAQQSRVVLVEGEIDRSYFAHFETAYPEIYLIPPGVEVVPYGGKDALKNASILQVMLNKFSKVYLTFDLDAEAESKKSLERVGLKFEDDFCCIGVPSPGAECIEGLLPGRVKQKVYAAHHELITALSSQDSSARKSAKGKLKQELLEELTSTKLSVEELKPFKELFKKVGAKFQ